MSGASNPATEAPAPATNSNTVAPAVLQQRAPSVRYIDAAQSDAIMESGTKSSTVSLICLIPCVSGFQGIRASILLTAPVHS